MNESWLGVVILLFLCTICLGQLKLPMRLSHRPDSTNLHQFRNHKSLHRLGIPETYKLKPQDMFFGIQLKVQGLDYLLSVDTGSSDFFIKGAGTAGKPKIKYDCPSCVKNNQHYTIGYLDGELYTYEAKLNVQLGNHSFVTSTLVAYRLQNKNFEDDGGILGLSYPQLARNPNPNFLSTLIQKGYVKEYAFGVNLNFKEDSNSYITLGTYDRTFFSGELRMHDIQSRRQYMLKSEGISFGNNSMLKITEVLLDTGNTCISIPNKYEEQIMNAFQYNVAGEQTGNKCFFKVQENVDMFSLLLCKVQNFKTLPVLSIHMDGVTYSIQKQFYLQFCVQRDSSEGDSAWYCDTFIESVRGMSQAILGDAFFTRFYSYFNLQTHQIGIATNNEVISLKQIQRKSTYNEDAFQKEWYLLNQQQYDGQGANQQDSYQSDSQYNSFQDQDQDKHQNYVSPNSDHKGREGQDDRNLRRPSQSQLKNNNKDDQQQAKNSKTKPKTDSGKYQAPTKENIPTRKPQSAGKTQNLQQQSSKPQKSTLGSFNKENDTRVIKEEKKGNSRQEQKGSSLDKQRVETSKSRSEETKDNKKANEKNSNKQEKTVINSPKKPAKLENRQEDGKQQSGQKPKSKLIAPSQTSKETSKQTDTQSASGGSNNQKKATSFFDDAADFFVNLF